MNKLEYKVNLPETRKKELIAGLEAKLNGKYGSRITLTYLYDLAQNENDDEIFFMEQWLKDKDVVVLGLNGPVSDKITNYDEVMSTIKDAYTPMSYEEQQEYYKKIKAGDKSARKEFAEKQMALSLWVIDKLKADKLKYVRMPKEDQLAYGFEGLMKAVDHFNPDSGCMFSTYAVPTIYNTLLRKIAEERRTNMGLSHNALELLDNVSNIESEFEAKGEKASNEDIGIILGLATDRVKEAKHIMKRIGYGDKRESIENLKDTEYADVVDEAQDGDEITETESGYVLDGVYIEGSSNTVEDVLGSEYDTYENVEDLSDYRGLREQLDGVLDTLTDREAKVLKTRFGLNDKHSQTLEETAVRFDVTRERIRQIEAKALRKLRHPSRAKYVKPYLDGEIYTGGSRPVRPLIESGWLELQAALKYPSSVKELAIRMNREKKAESVKELAKKMEPEKKAELEGQELNDEDVKEDSAIDIKEDITETNTQNNEVADTNNVQEMQQSESIELNDFESDIEPEDDLSDEFEEFFDETDNEEKAEVANEPEKDVDKDLSVLNQALAHSEQRLDKINEENRKKAEKLEKLREAEEAVKKYMKMKGKLKEAEEESDRLDSEIDELEKLTKRFFGELDLDEDELEAEGGKGNE